MNDLQTLEKRRRERERVQVERFRELMRGVEVERRSEAFRRALETRRCGFESRTTERSTR